MSDTATLEEKVGCRIVITVDDIGENREFVADFLKLCGRHYPFARPGAIQRPEVEALNRILDCATDGHLHATEALAAIAEYAREAIAKAGKST